MFHARVQNYRAALRGSSRPCPSLACITVSKGVKVMLLSAVHVAEIVGWRLTWSEPPVPPPRPGFDSTSQVLGNKGLSTQVFESFLSLGLMQHMAACVLTNLLAA